MRVGIFGTGMVAAAIAPRLFEVEHEVCIGARSSDSDTLEPFAAQEMLTGNFAETAATSDLVINATNGNHSVSAVASAADELAGKTLLDLANRLDPSRGLAHAALAGPDSSLAVDLQEAAPEAAVVKALNTMNCNVMVNPSLVPGDHVVFISGDSEAAKHEVRSLLGDVGWRDSQLIDLGGLETASGPEMLMQLWLDVFAARGGPESQPFNFAING